ncbi:hypothetical protein B7494_g4946 [Chlorociboria aeruginascens]|nr:hypothetical protein B7494_g4946 [Chlorociboria aeruginascens]
MDLQDLVKTFNRLPRTPRTPSGLVNNHWQFAVRHVPLHPPSDLLHIVNPGSFYTHCEESAQILTCLSTAAQANIVLPLLLKAFINATGNLHDPNVNAFAPWSWGTHDVELAKALEELLKSSGVRKELCTIRVGDEKSIQAEEELWPKLLSQMRKMVGPKCHKCKNGPADGTQGLLLCGGCRLKEYCSKDCQKADWKDHKENCKVISLASPSDYYYELAPIMPKAQALASKIGLTLGTKIYGQVTGKDTPENIATLLGSNEKKLVQQIHQDARIEVLLRPPPGSPMYAMSKSCQLDQNFPPSQWTPREASPEEEKELKKIREMQETIRRHMGSRGVKDITSQDMTDILGKNSGANLDEALQRYMNAVNTMDRGGSSVAEAFLGDPAWKIRGTSRDPSKPSCQALVAKGVEIVAGDVDDAASLKAAVQGADVVFGNTAFHEAFARGSEEDYAKLKPNQTLREWCYELEVQQGKNIADAVATVKNLELFIWSYLSDATKWSKGKYKGIFHFDSKAKVVEYIHEKYPAMAAKMSLLQMGLFITNWKWGQGAVPWEKRLDNSLILRIPGTGNIPIPLVVPSDAGSFTKALTKVPPGKNLLAFGDLLTWQDYVDLWSRVTGVNASLEHKTVEDHDKLAPGGYGEEIGEMYAYAQEFGYWGGDPSVIYPNDLGVDMAVTRIEDYIRGEDWSELLKLPAPSA